MVYNNGKAWTTMVYHHSKSCLTMVYHHGKAWLTMVNNLVILTVVGNGANCQKC